MGAGVSEPVVASVSHDRNCHLHALASGASVVVCMCVGMQGCTGSS